MIRIYIAASTPVARAGLDAVLRAQPDFELVSSETPADVVIADAITNGPGPPTVLLSDDPPRAWAAELLRGEVRAVLPNDATAAQIIAAVYAAAAGLVVVPVEDATAVLPETRSDTPLEPLTHRETQVLEMLAEGLSNKEIAARLGISDHTAKFHVNSILAKLNAGTRTEAVTRGIRAGLIMV